MATVIRNTAPELTQLADAHNQMKDSLVAELRGVLTDLAAVAADGDVNVTTTFTAFGSHNDKSEVLVTGDDADGGAEDDGLQGCIDLANELKAVYNFHVADTLAHKVAGSPVTTAKAHDLDTVKTLAAAIRTAYEAHRQSTTYHYVADSTNTISASSTSTLADVVTLVNELKADLNAHMGSGPTMKSIRLVGA